MKTLIFGYVMKVRLLQHLLFASVLAIFGCAPFPPENEVVVEIPENSTYEEIVNEAQQKDPSASFVRVEQINDKQVVVIRSEHNNMTDNKNSQQQRKSTSGTQAKDAFEFPSFSGVQFPNIFDIFRP